MSINWTEKLPIELQNAIAPLINKINELEGNLTTLKNSIPIELPIGGIVTWPSDVIPDRYTLCDGKYLDKTQYNELYRVVGGIYGENGSMFRVPDYRGVFLRMRDHGRGLDENRPLNHFQDDAIRNITGWFGNTEESHSKFEGAFKPVSALDTHGSWGGAAYAEDKNTGFNVYFDASTVVPTADQNRPRNITVNYIIRII